MREGMLLFLALGFFSSLFALSLAVIMCRAAARFPSRWPDSLTREGGPWPD